MHAFPVTIAPCASQLSSAHHCEDPRLAMIREEQNKKYKCPRNGENAGTMHIGYTGPASAQAKNAHTTIWCGVDISRGPARAVREWRINGQGVRSGDTLA